MWWYWLPSYGTAYRSALGITRTRSSTQTWRDERACVTPGVWRSGRRVEGLGSGFGVEGLRRLAAGVVLSPPENVRV